MVDCWVEGCGCGGCGASDDRADFGEGFAAEEDEAEGDGPDAEGLVLDAESPPAAVVEEDVVPAAIGRSFRLWSLLWSEDRLGSTGTGCLEA